MSYKPNEYVDDVAFKQALKTYNEKVKGKSATITSLSELNEAVVDLQTILGGSTGAVVSVAKPEDIRSLFS